MAALHAAAAAAAEDMPPDARLLCCQAGLLPAAVHASASASSGDSQTLATLTIGADRDKQVSHSLEGTSVLGIMLQATHPGFAGNAVSPLPHRMLHVTCMQTAWVTAIMCMGRGLSLAL